MSWFNLSDNINLLSMIGAIAILLITAVAIKVYFDSIKDGKIDGELTDDSWDGIKEYKNPLPLGWALTYLVLCVWAIWYMYVGYPLNSYSQIGEYNEEVQRYNDNFQNQWSNLDEHTLVEMGESVFLVQCAPCHGITGDGIGGKAADLNKWGSNRGVTDAIIKGSKGLKYDMGDMDPMASGTVANEEDAKAVATYMMSEISLAKHKALSSTLEAGRVVWENSCSACHGEDGKGFEGASPDLTLYGTTDFVLTVLNRGKQGHIGDMPKFDDGRLTDIQKKAVATYILSLSR